MIEHAVTDSDLFAFTEIEKLATRVAVHAREQ